MSSSSPSSSAKGTAAHSRSNSASTPEPPNGHDGAATETTANEDDMTPEQLRAELRKTREEKDGLATQYNTLLAKLTDMRTRLGTKLKEDAEELDRREQLIESLTLQTEDLSSTVQTLQSELVASNAECDRLDALRTQLQQQLQQQDSTAHESLQRERELRQTQLELEKTRTEKEEWERLAGRERAIVEDVKSELEGLRRDLDLEREARRRDGEALEKEREKAANLQEVLLDFQAAKDHELKQAIKDYETQVMQVTQSLAEYKHRAHTAELKLEENDTTINRTQELEKELKDKNLLIGKLRHEAVIINEHLVEALRRLRKSSTENNVDKRLVTNVVLSFITTPRADSKRFEMLNLLASILGWNDGERERAGLQRHGSGGGGGVTSPQASSGFWGRSISSSGASPSPKTSELQKSDETESFSRLWVEFLLTEANGEPKPPTQNGSLPNSPTSPTNTLPLPGQQGRRISSSTNLPTLGGLGTGSRKGKEKEVVGGS